jgi:hypothetical protein
LGFYVLYYSLLGWVFPFDGALIQTDIALIFSFVLFFIAPAICLYKPKNATGLGLICLAGITPFGIHWVQYRLLNEYFIVEKPENVLMYFAIVWYLMTLIATINTYTVRHNLQVKYYSKNLKLVLALLPLVVFGVLVVYFTA